MSKWFKHKFSVPIATGAMVLTILLSVAYSNWVALGTENLYQKMKIFTAVLQTIQRVYVEEVDQDKLVDDAIRGMVKNLDPHTNYMTASEVEEWNKTYQGYSGIGISFDIVNNKITIMSVMEGGPSYQLGLIPGDRIIQINGESAIGIKRDDVPKKLMGPPETTVNITVEREGWDEPKDYTVVRQNIHVPSMPSALFLDDGLGYIRIARFSSTTGAELEEALTKLETQKMNRLILDLRGNSGGYLQMAVEVAEKFIPADKMIVFTKGRIPSAYREYNSSSAGKHRMYPLIVLIDHGSASASEIVAGAMQDWDRGLVMGETSFGKGLVQTQYPFPDGSQLLITTARYYTPSGRLIQREYNDKSWEEYYKEAYNDSLRSQKLASLPQFKTFAGRTVYGGGGITPDIWLSSKNVASSQFVIRLYYDPKRFLYTFSEDLLRQHPEYKKMSALQFSKEVNFNDDLIASFANYVLKQKYPAKMEDFTASADDIKFLLKREIAYRLWNEDGQFYVNLLRDDVLLTAEQYFPDAKKLLAQSVLPKN